MAFEFNLAIAINELNISWSHLAHFPHMPNDGRVYSDAHDCSNLLSCCPFTHNHIYDFLNVGDQNLFILHALA